jgi:hypothetical protein
MKPLVKVPLKFGSIAGVLGFLFMIGLYYMGRHPFLIHIIMDFRIILFAIFIFFTLKELRDFHQGGILYFWQGLIASFLFTTVYAILTFTAIITFATVVPEFVTTYITQSIVLAKSISPEVIEQIGKDVYERNLSTLPSTNAIGLAQQHTWQSYFISLFISIILAVILRRQPKN